MFILKSPALCFFIGGVSWVFVGGHQSVRETKYNMMTTSSHSEISSADTMI